LRNTQLDDTAKGIILGIFAFVLVFSVVPAPIAKAANAPYFSMTLIAPTSNPARRQWAQIIQNSYVGAGIDAHLVYMSFGQWLGLLLGNTTCPAGQPFIGNGQNCPEPDFANGGWDAGFVGNGGGTVLPDFGTQNVVLYLGSIANDFPPNGGNYYWWTNSTYNQLASQYSATFNATARLPIAQQMVKIVADQRPGIVIEYPLEIYAFNPTFKPWGTTNAVTSTTAGIDFQHWQTGSVSTVNVAVTGGLDAVNPLPNAAQNSFYDRYLYGPVSAASVSGGGALEEADARGTGVYYDAIANSVTSSADHLNYTVNFKPHIFQDGVNVTADDYVFTNMAELITDTAYVGSGTLAGIVGNQVEFHYLNGTVDYVNGGVYQHGGSAPAGWNASSVWHSQSATQFSFTLPHPYLFTDPLVTGGGALPMHIYEQVPFSQWTTSPLSGFTSGCTDGALWSTCSAGGLSQNNFKVTWNTARYGGNGSYIAYGPVSDGAYVYQGYNPTTQTGTLVKFAGYWNATGLESMNEFTVSTINVVSIPAKDAAIAAYGTGATSINFLDAQYTFNKDDATALAGLGAMVARVNDPANGWQEMPLNDVNPIWGTGTGTPAGMNDSAHAATYAKDVRVALSLLVPRQSIVNNLLQGLATPGITEFFPTQGIIHPGDIYNGIQADPYDQDLAESYLAAAGYNTGFAAPSQNGQGGSQISVPPITFQGVTLNVPGFILGSSATFAGTFPVIPAQTGPASGIYVTLEQTAGNGGNGSSWEPVALGTATSGGYYDLAYTPTNTGNYSYRVFFTGVPTGYTNGTAGPLAALTVPGPGFVESYVPPNNAKNALPADNITDTQYSSVTTLNIGSTSSLFSQLAQGINNAIGSLAKSTNASISAVNTNVVNLGTSITNLQNSQTGAAKQSDLTALSTQVTNLNNQVSTLTDVAYAALAVAVILGLLAIVLSRRKPSA
jgi:ABC-type transport system substrate-binding protein